MFRQDMIKRAIEQLAAALAKIMGLAHAQQHAEALDAVRDAKSALPLVPGLLEDMDAETLIDSLGVERAELLARVLAAEADVLDRMGRSLLAERPRRRSVQLLERLGVPRAGRVDSEPDRG